MQRNEGVPTSIIDEHALASLESRGFYERDLIGCWEEDAGSVDAISTVAAMAAEVHARGGRLSIGESFTGLVLEGTRAIGVTTTHGTIHGESVVLATGPWSGALTRELGATIPLAATRARQSWLRPPASAAGSMPVFGDVSLGYYWRQERGGLLRIGDLSTTEEATVDNPDVYDETADDAFVSRCRSAVEHRLPAMAHATTVGGGCGLYTVTPDSHAVIGPIAGMEALYLVTGFSGHGFKLAPGVARGVSEWIRDGKPQAFPAEFFDPARFERGELHGGNYDSANILG
jgi:glycine/D-amino acid oxidase-like deaminating enzyme